ncbi:hypothetical protein [Gordonia sp. VNK21]|uniref:hypothetical protein n=1 Tax=Gordonia sp. VNK21 TaxID=3382483 RepID=UPI0038D35E57
MLDELEVQARSMYDAGEYEHALAEFSVLREIRSRREGPYSVKYLAAMHECVRCMRHLQLWQDSDLLCSELHGKYLRTHGRAEADTVDVAKHWAWAMVHLDAIAEAVALYLVTADALWEVDRDGAGRLLGAAAAHRGPGAGDDDPLAGLSLTHTTELAQALREVADLADGDRPAVGFDGVEALQTG